MLASIEVYYINAAVEHGRSASAAFESVLKRKMRKLARGFVSTVRLGTVRGWLAVCVRQSSLVFAAFIVSLGFFDLSLSGYGDEPAARGFDLGADAAFESCDAGLATVAASENKHGWSHYRRVRPL